MLRNNNDSETGRTDSLIKTDIVSQTKIPSKYGSNKSPTPSTHCLLCQSSLSSPPHPCNLNSTSCHRRHSLTVMAHSIYLSLGLYSGSFHQHKRPLSLLLLTQIQDAILQNNSYFFKKFSPTMINYTVSLISEPHIKLASFT